MRPAADHIRHGRLASLPEGEINATDSAAAISDGATERTSTSSSIARMPPARAGIADSRDNLVSSTVSTLRSAVMRRVVARGQLECVCPWRLAPSEPRSRQELRSLPAVRDVWHHHRRCLLTHLLPSVVLRVDPAGSCKPLKSEQGCELDDSSKLQPTSSDGCLGRIMPGAPTKQHRNPTARRRSGVAE